MGIITVDTKKYIGVKRIVIDGNDWEVKLPGAGKELAMNQIKRRTDFLDKKISSGDYTEEDLDNYDKYEKQMYDMFEDMFSDGKDNSSVREWVENTPFALIMQVFEDIKEQSQSKNEVKEVKDVTSEQS